MAKKVRGTRSTHRPGGQGPSRKKTSAASTSAAEGVSEATTEVTGEAKDETLETLDGEYTEITHDESEPAATPAAAVAPAESKRRRARRRNKAKADDLASRSAAEDVWVRADLRRIGIVSVVLLVALAVSWVLFYAMDVLNLY